MSNFESYFRILTWLIALLLSAFAAGCGGGGQGPILGGGGIAALAPMVTATAPLATASIVTGVEINSKITATFTKDMAPETIGTSTFTLGCPAAVPGTVAYVAASRIAIFTPTANLPTNATCTATVTTGATDTTGIPLASNFTWTFATGAVLDITPPRVSATIPANNATGVPINAKVDATFSEAMDPSTITTTTFTLKQGATAVPGTVTYSGVSAVFTPAGNLAASTTYTATITTGAQCVEGVAMAANYTWSWTTAAAPDTTAPTVTGTIHANGATNVAINAKVGATFSEGMDPLTVTNVNFTLKETVTGTAVAGTVSYSGVSAVFIPASNLAFSTRYTVTVKGGVSGAKDLAGNALANDFVISWTTAAAPDTTAPTVTGTIHANGATNVAINAKVGATFSEGMDPLTVTNVNFTLKETVTGTAVAGTVSYSGVSAVFIPLSNLASSTGYTVTVKGGVGGVTDLAGNPMASDFVISWTTAAAADTTPPTVIRTIYANGAVGVSINAEIGATFSEGMDPLTITTVTVGLRQGATAVPGTVTYTSMNAVFTPASSLAPATLYTATITAGATDLAGNALTSPYSWSFTTGAAPDTTAPTVSSTVPLATATGVPVNTHVTAIFSEPMDPLSVTTASVSLACPAGTPISGTVDYGVTGNVMTFTPIPGSLPANTTCTATIGTGAKDVAGNALASALSWTFSTAVGRSFCEQSFTQTDHFTAGSSINGQNGWSDAGGFDEQVQNVGAAAYGGQNVWKLSSKTTSGSYSNQPLSPQLSESAGESTVRSAGGGDAFEAVFWMRPVSPSADGSSITISLSPSSSVDRQTYFRIINDLDANGGFQTVFIDYYDVANTGNWRTFTTSTAMSRTAWTKVRMVMEAPDGGTNDIVQIWLDDHLVGTYSTWEDYHTWTSGGDSVTEDVDRLLFRVSAAASSVDPSFIDANSQGFYFDSMCYRVYNRTTPSSTIQFYRTGFEP
jgi:hypothetical protein